MSTISSYFNRRPDRMTRSEIASEMRLLADKIKAGEATAGQTLRYERLKAAHGKAK